MQTHAANEISMWSAVENNEKRKALAQLQCLQKIMEERFSSVLFRNALDYIFYQAFNPDNIHGKWVKKNFEKLIPRTESAQNLISRNGISAVRKELKIEHIVSVKKLSCL